MHHDRTDHASPRERGIALVAAVLVVMLCTVLVAAFMTTTVGERSISSNVQTAKISLYAADAGVRVNEQYLANLAQAKLDSCVAAWTAAGALPSQKIISAPASLFPAGGLTTTASNPPFTSTGTIAFQDSAIHDTSQVYNFLFTIQSTGNTRATGLRRVQAQGLLRVSAERGSFADYLLFTNTHTMADGSAVWFSSSVRFDGRVHTNTTFRFAYQPRFDDLVTSHDSQAWFYNNNHPVQANASNYAPYDSPIFGGHFYRGEPTVTLPTNTYNQQAMAAGSPSDMSTAPTNTQLNTWLGTGAGSGSVPNGVYVPNSGGAVAGGIYIQGSASQVKMWCDTTSNIQYYSVTQGSSVTTVRVNPNTTPPTTTVTPPSGTATTYNGVPRGALYCTGSISDLRGPDRVSGNVIPAIAEGTKLLVCAANDVVIQRDIVLDNYNAATNVLGIYSAGGAVRVGTSAPNDCNLDAFLMATGSTSGQFTVDNYNSGSPRGTFHLRGGMVASYYGAFYTFDSNGVLKTGYARDFHYDKRGLIPPYYPTTNRFRADRPIARTLSWKEI